MTPKNLTSFTSYILFPSEYKQGSSSDFRLEQKWTHTVFCFWEFKTIFTISIMISFLIELQLSLNRVHIFRFITRSHITLKREDIPCWILEDVSKFGNESGLVRRQYHENILEILRVHQERMIHYNIRYYWM